MRLQSETEGAVATADEGSRRLFAALSATNEAILKATDPSDLYRKVCQAIVHISGFKGAAVAVPVEHGTALRYVCNTDRDRGAWDLSQVPALPVGPGNEDVRGFIGEAFDTGLPVYSNDYEHDPRLAHPKLSFMRAIGVANGIKSTASVPLLRDGKAVAVVAFYLQDRQAIDQDMLKLMLRIADNTAFALGNFEKVEQKRRAERASERLRQLYAALSLTNEALLRALDEDEMFTGVCEAVLAAGRTFGAAIFTRSADGTRLEFRAYAGEYREYVRRMPLSLVPGEPFSGGLHASAMKEGCIQFSDDVRTDPRTKPWVDIADESIPHRAVAAAPLVRGGRPIGVMFFFGDVAPPNSTALLELMERIARNVSFKLDALASEGSRKAAEQNTVRMNRMFRSLGGVNEAIIQAQTAQEMFESVCSVASTGGATLGAAVLLYDPDTRDLVCQASAGPLTALLGSYRVSCRSEDADQLGLIGKAFRAGEPLFVTDLETDPRPIRIRESALKQGVRAFSALPLACQGELVGTFLFIQGADAVMDAEARSLMRRMTDNVSFALGNFARDDARERMGRMFAALSATNEAIMRAKGRDELFALVSEAAEQSGNFSSVLIATKQPDTDILRIEFVVGRAAEDMRGIHYSTSVNDPHGRGLAGTAFRSRRIAYSNDYLANPEFAAFHETMSRTGQRAGASVPLMCHGEPVGVLLLMADRRNTFNPEYLDLVDRFGRNISYALDNFAAAEERRAADERIHYLATHDEMTALPNRATFSHMLNASIRASARHDRKLAVLFIDLDRFKVINDTLGHEAGDALLIETGRRITSCLRADDIVARLGGDEFVVILNEVRAADGVATVANNLMTAIGKPIDLSGHNCRVTASIGIAVYPDHGLDEQTLTKCADMAMYAAKEDGKNGFKFFSDEINQQSIERLTMEASLRQALERGEFLLHYQPKLDLATEQVSGVEALIRWEHPELGLVSPGQFVPLAEETGLIVPIGRWVLNEACRQYMAWQSEGVGPVRMAVNLSPRQFNHESILKDIDDALADSGMPAEMLQLEVTESMVMQNVARAIALLDAIKARGCYLAIDDFGTGYSSMSLLKRFPVDTLKIDRSFVRDLPLDQEDVAITQAIISMAKALGLTVVAEGVETIEQKVFLDRQACDEMQGFLFSKPLPGPALADLLRNQPPAAPLVPLDGPRERRRIGERRRALRAAEAPSADATVH